MEAYSSMRRRFADFSGSFANAGSNLGKYRNLFIAHLIHMGQVKSIPVATAALNFFYGRLDDGDAEVQKLLVDSAKREAPPIIHRRKASQEDIDAIVEWGLRNNSDEAVTESSIILLSFLAFLRIGETACVRKKDSEDKGNGTWWLRIPRSKTDQQRLGSTVAFKVQGKAEELWHKFTKVLKNLREEQFIFATRPGDRPTTDALRKRMNSDLNRAGLGHKGLTPHSFRGGAATVALRNGVNQEDIKRVGRWKSTSALLHYLDPTPL
ncbi:site-specific recombinase, phage integrase family [Ancylostoma caninum]|uniref:Site-specific recombinase, phage integrase family n=1 Tax=Ancylostoma caninum TaxID=29170 RepID=A0A368GD57_ANCCA|nr:site-specific recombinase, phage integrase family [Ancylostoma caninum]